MWNNDEGGGKVAMRPMGGSSNKGKFYGKCDVRLTRQEDLELSRLAEKNGVTRSEVMRKALRDFVKFNTDEE